MRVRLKESPHLGKKPPQGYLAHKKEPLPLGPP